MLEIPLKADGTKDYDALNELLNTISKKVAANAKTYDEAVAMYRSEGLDEKTSMILAGYSFPD